MGTQYNMLSSLHDCQKAIYEWTVITPVASTARRREIIRIANSHSFWWQLKELVKILKPLHITQKESEARNSSIMEVTERWQDLHEGLRTLASQIYFLRMIPCPIWMAQVGKVGYYVN